MGKSIESHWRGMSYSKNTPIVNLKYRASKEYINEFADLFNYQTGEFIRKATQAETDASDEAAENDDGHGLIVVNGVTCFVG